MQYEDVAQIGFVAVRPQLHLRLRIDQLRRDPHAIALTKNGTADQRVGVQLTRDFSQRLLRPLVLHHRAARDDPIDAEASQVGDEGVGHPVGEVFLRRIARKILQRQNSDGMNSRRRRPEPRQRRRHSNHDRCCRHPTPGNEATAAQILRQIRRGLISILRFLLQALEDDSLQRSRHLAIERWSVIEN